MNRIIPSLKTLALALAVVATVAAFAAIPGHAAEITNFDIPPGELSSALKSLAKQTGLELIFQPGDLKGIQTQGVKGNLSPQDAVAKLISGTKLTITTDSAGAILIAPARISASTPTADASQVSDLRLAQTDQSQSEIKKVESAENQNPESEKTNSSTSADVEENKTQEVLVTGTHIRGATNSASPIQVYGRNEIDRTGLGSVQEFIQRLPQNFNGGASEDTVAELTGGGGVANMINGTGVNLRGLGTGTTLVLLNGRRIAPGNITGNFVDVSTIPLNAVERIEVVADGASAIYGSDAIGGAVNFILRRDFAGPETRVRYGSVTQGDSREFQLGQTAGANWSGGSALLSYEFYSRSALDAKDRGRSKLATFPLNLLPEQKRHAALITAQHITAAGLELFADGTYARRHAPFSTAIENGFAEHDLVDLDSYSATAGARTDLFDRFEFELSSTYAGNDTHVAGFDLPDFEQFMKLNVSSSVYSIDAKINGPLWETAAGPILFAIGGQHRTEDFDNRDLLNSNVNYRNDRDVLAGFVEVRVPLLGPNEAIPSTSRLELIFADRHEQYSDFGSTNNPKFGVVWHPTPDLKFRGSYGTSFKAPILNDLNSSPSIVFSTRAFDPLVGNNRNAIVIIGGNPDLTAEEATTWSIGADLRSHRLSGLRAEVTYYDIDFKSRVVSPSSTFSFAQALRNEAILGPTIVQRDPSNARLQDLVADPAFRNIFGVDPTTAVAILDFRKHNLSLARTSGVDLGLSYAAQTARGQWEVGIDTTYVLEFDRQFSSTAGSVEILNTPYNPVDLRLRGRGIFTHGDATLALFINYTDSYRDNRVGVARSLEKVKSWTTVDATIGYEIDHDKGILGNISAMLGVTNITDEAPPFVANAFASAIDGIDFDGANSNVLGRFVYLQLSKRW